MTPPSTVSREDPWKWRDRDGLICSPLMPRCSTPCLTPPHAPWQQPRGRHTPGCEGQPWQQRRCQPPQLRPPQCAHACGPRCLRMLGAHGGRVFEAWPHPPWPPRPCNASHLPHHAASLQAPHPHLQQPPWPPWQQGTPHRTPAKGQHHVMAHAASGSWWLQSTCLVRRQSVPGACAPAPTVRTRKQPENVHARTCANHAHLGGAQRQHNTSRAHASNQPSMQACKRTPWRGPATRSCRRWRRSARRPGMRHRGAWSRPRPAST